MINNDEIIGWDDEISQESNFTLFPEGDYSFTVTNFERKVFEPNPNRQSKIEAGTPMIGLELTFLDAAGQKTMITENLFMLKKTAWKISEFLISIGQKKKGEPVVPNWQKVLGSTGVATLEVNHYIKKDGNAGENNRVKKFLEPVISSAKVTEPSQTVTPFPTANGGTWK